MSETIQTVTAAEHPDFRARVVADPDPQMPENDGAAPVLHMWRGADGWHAEIIQFTATQDWRLPKQMVDDIISKAVLLLVGDSLVGHAGPLAFGRIADYLRTNYGALGVRVKSYQTAIADGRGAFGYYMVFDPSFSREKWGFTDESAREWYEAHPGQVLDDMAEFDAYLRGEVYGVIVERQDVWVNQRTGAASRQWAAVETRWGFYGDLEDVVLMAAQEMIEEAAV